MQLLGHEGAILIGWGGRVEKIACADEECGMAFEGAVNRCLEAASQPGPPLQSSSRSQPRQRW
jgi:hypothetical protein